MSATAIQLNAQAHTLEDAVGMFNLGSERSPGRRPAVSRPNRGGNGARPPKAPRPKAIAIPSKRSTFPAGALVDMRDSRGNGQNADEAFENF